MSLLLYLVYWGREGKTYYATIYKNLQTLPVWSAACPTVEGTVSIPQCNYVPGEQAFMQSPSVPVIGAGKQNLVQAFQAIFAQMKQKTNMQRV